MYATLFIARLGIFLSLTIFLPIDISGQRWLHHNQGILSNMAVIQQYNELDLRFLYVTLNLPPFSQALVNP